MRRLLLGNGVSSQNDRNAYNFYLKIHSVWTCDLKVVLLRNLCRNQMRMCHSF